MINQNWAGAVNLDWLERRHVGGILRRVRLGASVARLAYNRPNELEAVNAMGYGYRLEYPGRGAQFIYRLEPKTLTLEIGIAGTNSPLDYLADGASIGRARWGKTEVQGVALPGIVPPDLEWPAGFLWAFRPLWREVDSLIARHRPLAIELSGHSLGGVMAAYAAIAARGRAKRVACMAIDPARGFAREGEDWLRRVVMPAWPGLRAEAYLALSKEDGVSSVVSGLPPGAKIGLNLLARADDGSMLEGQEAVRAYRKAKKREGIEEAWRSRLFLRALWRRLRDRFGVHPMDSILEGLR